MFVAYQTYCFFAVLVAVAVAVAVAVSCLSSVTTPETIAGRISHPVPLSFLQWRMLCPSGVQHHQKPGRCATLLATLQDGSSRRDYKLQQFD